MYYTLFAKKQRTDNEYVAIAQYSDPFLFQKILPELASRGEIDLCVKNSLGEIHATYSNFFDKK